jgi:outer membrane protein, multidrug efflux system
MYKFSALMLVSAALLGGCTMIPEYSRPESPVAAEWPVQAPPAVDDEGKPLTPAASVAWQEFFQSPHLQEVLATALDNNRDLRVALLNVEAARNAYRIQRAEILPSVDGNVGGVRQKITRNTPFNAGGGSAIYAEYYTAEVTGSWEVDIFGRLRSLNRWALESYFASEEERRAVQVALIAETANAYLQLLADREILDLTKKTFEAQQSSYKLVSQRFEKGIAGKLELAQARIPLETARVNYALYSRLIQQDINALTLLMGRENTKALLGNDKLENVKLLEALPIGLPSDVLLLRPDIRQAEHELLSANANIGAARAAFFPRITLAGGIGQSSAELSDLFSGPAGEIWSFTPSISVPLFSGGANWANLLVSQNQRDIAVANYEKAIQVAFREVADELAARATLDDQLQAQADLVQAATDAYDTSRARYDQGVDSFLSVLDAQRSQYEAQQMLIETQKQRLANTVNLYKVLGGGQVSAQDAAAIATPASPAIAPDEAEPAEPVITPEATADEPETSETLSTPDPSSVDARTTITDEYIRPRGENE